MPEDQVLSARLLNGLFLASFPILLCAIAVRLALGVGLTETANLTLLALVAAGVLGAFILRSGRVYLAGFVLTLALWAAGTFMSWMYFGIRDATAVIPLLAVLIAFVVLPWQAGFLLTVLSVSSIWLFVARELRSPPRPGFAAASDAGFTLTAVMILASLLALVFGEILHQAVRQTIAARQSLSKSEEELASILQRTPDIIYRLDAEGRIAYVNDAVRRYGYQPSEMVGTPLLNYVHPKDRDVARHCVNERRTGDRSTKALEIRFLTRQGDERVAEYTAVPVFEEPVFLLEAEGLYDDGPEPRHYRGTQGIARDITDRKRAEEALRKSEEKYSLLFRAAPAGFIVASLEEALILDANEEFESIFGYQHEELFGQSALDLGIWVNPPDRQRIVDLLRSGELAKDRQVQGRTKSGEVRVLRYNAQQIEIDGTVCLLSAVEDITDRRRLESQLQQAQKLEALGRLAGGIAHDFNNVLTVILGQAEMASRDLAPTNPVQGSIQEIRKAAQRSSELTRQLLMFARKQDAAPRALNLNHAVSDRLRMLQRLVGENVTLNWNPGSDLWPVKIDSAHVDQILVNLVVNARDAMTDVGTLTISTENRLQESMLPQGTGGGSPGQWVLLTVTDTGTGMSSEALAHIFEPFYTTKGLGQGTGLGLATVYGIIQHGGGRIEVASVLGKGTTFRIYLPRTHEVATGAHDADQEQLASGRETVLVVDDEPGVLKFVRTTLQKLGYSVVEAASAKDALGLAENHEGPLHLLLTDVVMPQMNGRDLHAKIAASRPETRVIFMSGYSTVSTKDDDPTLQKPFSMQQLSAKVRGVLDMGQSKEERS